MNEKLSSWVDGELDPDEAGRVLNSLAKDDGALRSKCKTYWQIGDSLREEPQLSNSFCDRVMEAINEEPTILAPVINTAASVLPMQQASFRWMSIAAAGAGVAVVGWMAYSFNKPEQTNQNVASTQNTSGLAMPSVNAKPAVMQPDAELKGDRAYVVAHQPYGGGGGVVPGVATYLPPQQSEPKK